MKPAGAGKSSDAGKGLRGLALQVSSLVRVNQVALGGFVHDGRERGAGFSGSGFVAGCDRGKSLLAKCLHPALFSAVPLGADDGLTCALDRRFVIGHGRILEKSVAWRRAGENRNLAAGVKLVFQSLLAAGTDTVSFHRCGLLVVRLVGLDRAANDEDIGTGANAVVEIGDILATHPDATEGSGGA